MTKINPPEYFEWLCDVVCQKRFARTISYSRLLKCLHSIEFRAIIPNDTNRAEDGRDLRIRYFNMTHIRVSPRYPCTVLEMMVALAIRCEETIMDNPTFGNRTGQWFWDMVKNLGLMNMTDDRFDENHVREVINIFLDREYEPDGQGGLFKIRHCGRDLREVEIWCQLSWYLDQFE